jgi:hypothetical protein
MEGQDFLCSLQLHGGKRCWQHWKKDGGYKEQKPVLTFT